MLLAIALKKRVGENDDIGRMVRLRIVTLVLALGLSAVGITVVIDVARDPFESWETAQLAYLLFSGLTLGGIIYSIGTVMWAGRRALVLRAFGWTVMAVPIFVPSTLSLLLPVVAVLFVTLRHIQGAPTSSRVSPRQTLA